MLSSTKIANQGNSERKRTMTDRKHLRTSTSLSQPGNTLCAILTPFLAISALFGLPGTLPVALVTPFPNRPPVFLICVPSPLIHLRLRVLSRSSPRAEHPKILEVPPISHFYRAHTRTFDTPSGAIHVRRAYTFSGFSSLPAGIDFTSRSMM